jgi:hypothetical protein
VSIELFDNLLIHENTGGSKWIARSENVCCCVAHTAGFLLAVAELLFLEIVSLFHAKRDLLKTRGQSTHVNIMFGYFSPEPIDRNRHRNAIKWISGDSYRDSGIG